MPQLFVLCFLVLLYCLRLAILHTYPAIANTKFSKAQFVFILILVIAKHLNELHLFFKAALHICVDTSLSFIVLFLSAVLTPEK